MSTVSDLINSGGGKSFPFGDLGLNSTITGTIASTQVVQRNNFTTGEPEFWRNDPAQPVQQIRVTLQTALRDPEDSDDEGVRNVYVKAWGDQLNGLRAAVRSSGAKDLEVGGTFTATWSSGAGTAASPRAYTYSYAKPSGTAGILSGQPATAPAPQQAAPAPQPVAAQPQAPAVPAPSPEALAAFAAWQSSTQQSA